MVSWRANMLEHMVQIADAHGDEVPEIARVLGVAFRDDPVCAVWAPRRRGRERRLMGVFEALLRSYRRGGARVLVARDDQVEEVGEPRAPRRGDMAGTAILGAAVWESPNRAISPVRQVVQAPALLTAIGIGGVRRLRLQEQAFAAYRPAEPHWYLALIGVSPAARGLGVGGALLRSSTKWLDRDGGVGYLESTTAGSRRLYERHGFVSQGTIRGFGTADSTAMLRRPEPPCSGAHV